LGEISSTLNENIFNDEQNLLIVEWKRLHRWAKFGRRWAMLPNARRTPDNDEDAGDHASAHVRVLKRMFPRMPPA